MEQGLVSCTVEVPGKVMLAGEYAVLRGASALACTVDAFMEVEVQCPNDQAGDGRFMASSDLWSDTVCLQEVIDSDKDRVLKDPLLDTAQFALTKYNLRNGSLSIRSKLDPTFGIGSSAALRLGVLLAIDRVAHRLNEPMDDAQTSKSATSAWDLAREAFVLQKRLQREASGYDIATQNVGGAIVIRPPQGNDHHWPGMIAKLKGRAARLNKYVHILVGGSGAPTGALTNATMTWLNERNAWNELLELSETALEAWVGWLSHEQPPSTHFYQLIGKQREFFAQTPAYPYRVAKLLQDLPGLDEQWTFKSTGAGGEDAIIFIGEEPMLAEAFARMKDAGWFRAPFSFSEKPAALKVN